MKATAKARIERLISRQRFKNCFNRFSLQMLVKRHNAQTLEYRNAAPRVAGLYGVLPNFTVSQNAITNL